jgi:hypothetical protein
MNHTSKSNFIMSPTRAIAPRLPCLSSNCTLCDTNEDIQKDVTLEMPNEKPKLIWNTLSDGLLPHLEYVKTPPRIY